ncbi:MAG: signal peptidase I [Bacteroides sp.]|nr:signal peptidase I [Bacteroides sp.]
MNKIKIGLNKLLSLCFILCVTMIVWLFFQITTFASFKIPSDSMEPALLPGDNIIVNKWVMGGRLFNIWDAAENKQINISRLPAFGKIKRNDVLVFNFPYPDRWDSLGLNLKTYYVKRCVAIPGDTFEIRNAHYKVRGYNETLGCVDSQDKLQQILSSREGQYRNIVMNGFPYDSLVDWSIREFGPLYIPAKGGSIVINSFNIALYKNVIEWEQKKKLLQRGDTVLLGDSIIQKYQFQEDYYFVAGDKVMNSKDSRYWGLLPEKFVVGKATLIWKSVNPITDEVRWNRIFKKIE